MRGGREEGEREGGSRGTHARPRGFPTEMPVNAHSDMNKQNARVVTSGLIVWN